MTPRLRDSWLQRHQGNLVKATPEVVELAIFLQNVARVTTLVEPAPLYLDVAMTLATSADKRKRLLELLDKCTEKKDAG